MEIVILLVTFILCFCSLVMRFIINDVAQHIADAYEAGRCCQMMDSSEQPDEGDVHFEMEDIDPTAKEIDN